MDDLPSKEQAGCCGSHVGWIQGNTSGISERGLIVKITYMVQGHNDHDDPPQNVNGLYSRFGRQLVANCHKGLRNFKLRINIKIGKVNRTPAIIDGQIAEANLRATIGCCDY